MFGYEAVSKQAKSLQVFETVYLLRSGEMRKYYDYSIPGR